MAINWPTPGFKGRTFKLCVLTRWDLISASAAPHCGDKNRGCVKKEKKKKNKRWQLCSCTVVSNEGSKPDILFRTAHTTAALARLKPVLSDKSISLRSNMRLMRSLVTTPQWRAADAEIKVPFGENTELKHSPFQAWSRSVYSHTCYAYCQGFLSFFLISTLPVHSPAFFPNLSQFFPVLAVANTWFLCRPAE